MLLFVHDHTKAKEIVRGFLMEWEQVAIKVGKFLLWMLEISFKLFAGITGLIILGATGAFGEKISIGFSSLSSSLRGLAGLPAKIGDHVMLVRDYNALASQEFEQLYGEQAVGQLLLSLNTLAGYAMQLYRNIVSSPVETMAAAAIGFGTFYLLARILRFYRQQGTGSYISIMERKLGEKVFAGTANRQAPVGHEKPVPRKSRPKTKKMARKKKKSSPLSNIPIEKARPLGE